MHSKIQLETAVGRYCGNLKAEAAAQGCTNSLCLSPILNPLSLHVCAHPHAHTCKVRCRSSQGMAAARDDLAGSVSPSGFNLNEEKWSNEKNCKGVINPFQLLSAANPPNCCL